MDRNKVVLVNPKDEALGEMDKMQAHIMGRLHRAFSVFIFNEKGEMLIHQRAQEKYHGAGLWTNACCSHPQWGENLESSAKERLDFEMGITCELNKAFSFLYHAPVENGLTEHEFDHVFIGQYSAKPIPNKEEVQNFAWVDFEALQQSIQVRPQLFTTWFKLIFPKIAPMQLAVR